MRVLLDENTPAELAPALEGLEAVHVEDLGLKGVLNGELLKVARSGYDVFVTFDKGIFHQHNHRNQTLIVVLAKLPDIRKETVLSHAAGLTAFIKTLSPGQLATFEPGS